MKTINSIYEDKNLLTLLTGSLSKPVDQVSESRVLIAQSALYHYI